MKINHTKKQQKGTQKVVNLAEQRKKRRKRNPGNRKGLLFVCLCLLAAGGILFSPLFTIGEIEFSELSHFSEEEICEKIGLSKGQNLFLFSCMKAEKQLLKDPYVQQVTIKRKLPSTVTVELVERHTCGYVPYLGSYLYIDEYGRVLHVDTSFTESLPIVEGLEFDRYQWGEILEVKNQKVFESVTQMAAMMLKYDELGDVVKIDVKNPNDVTAYVNQIKIYLGDLTESDKKIQTMAAVIKKMKEEGRDQDRGSLDLRDLKKPIIFQYLT